MAKIPIQFPRYKFDGLKNEAIERLTAYINGGTEEFIDGEEIVLKYKDENGEYCTTNCTVCLNDLTGEFYLSSKINDNDTIKIIESETEPEDKDKLWLTPYASEDDFTGETRNLREEIIALKREMLKMQELVKKHDYALSSTIAGGDIITNSEKYHLENSAEPEKPEDATDYEQYAESDFEVTSFDLYIGNSTLYTYTNLYKGQKYYLKLKMFNSIGERVPESGETLTIEYTPTEIATIDENRILYAQATGLLKIFATLTTREGVQLQSNYTLKIEYNEEPDYITYSEPNVHHMLIKTVDSYQILKENLDYLCLNELIWCKSDNSLYLKAEAMNGIIQLFKINGTGGSEPITGDTSGDTTAVTSQTTYVVDGENTLIIESSDNSVSVDADGYLVIGGSGEVTNNILILNDQVVTGSTTGDTQEDSSTAVIDGDGTVDIGGNTDVSSGNVLSLNAVVTSDGILEITT